MEQKITPSQKTAITQNMRQSLDILSMPQEELVKYLEEEIANNPLLERVYKKSYVKEERPNFFSLSWKKSIFDHLLSQAREIFSKEELKVSEYVIGNLDEKGFFKDRKALYSIFKTDGIERIIKKIQTFDPVGLATEDMQERILVQLKNKGKEKSLGYRIIKDHFKEFLYKRGSLEKKISKKKLKKEIGEIKKYINLYPLTPFKENPLPEIKADIKIKHEGKNWTIDLQNQSLPEFKVNGFGPLLKSSITRGEKEFIRFNILKGRWLRSAIFKREKSLFDIAKFIIYNQREFLLNGRDIKPLSYKDAAKSLKKNISTISRIISGKYIDTPFGLFSLKIFFQKKVNKIPKKKIFLSLLNIIKNEKAPLSDEDIKKRLFERGISISRRTVSKYRKNLDIPKSSLRDD